MSSILRFLLPEYSGLPATAMAEERSERHESPSHLAGDDFSEGGAVPMRMQMFSTWEVRKVPANCVSRLCMLTVTRLQVVRPLEPGIGSVVLSASMKTPHRVLRSNQINLPLSGLLDVPLEWTYSLQYPHFLKRGGNVLLIRLQRRKRVGNRPLGGYKTLAIGRIDMSQVLQHSFQGEVKLYSEKGSELVAMVTVRSLTSTAVDLERRANEASSEEDEDDIFSDDMVERVSDSESGGEEQAYADASGHGKGKRFMPSTAAVLRLLRLSRPSKAGHHDPVGELLEEAEGVEFRESSVAFASSPSDSDEELTGAPPSPPRPTLSPFFGSDRCSMVSLPTSAKSAESMVRLKAENSTNLSKKYGSLEKAIQDDRMNSPAMSDESGDQYDWDFAHGRLWCVAGDQVAEGAVVRGLERDGEVVVRVEGDTVHRLMSLMNALHKEWRDRRPFTVVLVGNDGLVSSAVQALVAASCSPDLLHFAIIPTAAGLMSARLASLDDKFQEAFPADGPWIAALQDGIDHLLQYIRSAEHSLPLPLAQAVIQRPLREPGAFEEVFLPFMCSVSIGAWDSEPTADSTPLSPPASAGPAVDYPEILLEYWSPRGQKSHQGSVKVRSVMVSCANSVLNVTATKDKKTKIRIRKPKEPESGGSIVSLTATQLICRPVTKIKGDGGVGVVVDGVEREGVSLVRLSAAWEHTLNRTFSLAVTSTLN